MTGKLTGGGLTPHEIYQQLTGGPGSGYLEAAQGATKGEWRREDERATMIRKLGEKIRMGWQGAASDAAFGASLPLAQAAMRGTDKLDSAQDLLGRQTGSFHDAANSVRPVAARPPENDVANELIPFETDLDKEIKAYQADAQHNIDVYHGYDNESHYNETHMPHEYSSITHSGGTITVKSPGEVSTVDSGDFSGDGGRDGGPGGGPGPGGSGQPGGGAPGGASVGGPPGGGSSTGTAGQTAPSQVGPAVFAQSPAASAMPGSGTAPPGGFFPGGAFPGGSGGRPGGPGGRPGGSSGGFGGRGPRGGLGAGSGSGGGVGGRGGVSGPGGGAGAGALAAEEAAIRRGAAAGPGARGAAGMPMGAMGAGHGKGDDDEEHDRKTMIESGGEDVFGSDVLTAPQVIGDDEYED
ncbi:MAG TPA: hypothetical protein VH969_06505 [Actinophytocola sp.]|uniref:hypothetical protein n=1 Tax=Actinophytocola sp. TaxID=1872138 RepID=UPI002F95B7A3